MNFDLLIRNATLVDGTGAARRTGGVAISGERIELVGELNGARGRAEIDAAGMVLAPGFIDVHTHDDRLLLSDPAMLPKLLQGVTTVVTGNCGISLAPSPPRIPPPLDLLDDSGQWYRFATFGAYAAALADARPATNCVALIGHSTLRVRALEDLEREATPAQVAAMRAELDAALLAGATGMSAGPAYAPAAAASTAELIEVARPLAAHRGIFTIHMRNEHDGVLAAIDETLAIGRALGVPVVISHHKVAGEKMHGRSVETLARIARAMRSQAVALDCYPYHASSTVLIADAVRFASRVLVTWSRPHPELAGLELGAAAQRLGLSQDQAIAALQPAGAVYFVMDEADVQRILAFGPTMVGSDGLPHDPHPHPRLWGTFPRVLGHYARDLALFPLETAVHKMTGLSASRFGLAGRGVIRAGAIADLVIFDAATIDDAATFEHPTRPAAGIDTVIVAGEIAVAGGEPTGVRVGKLLTGRVGAGDAAWAR